MNVFPSLDPIPLPAPVWLLKALHDLTLALHFIAMEMLLGGLFIVLLLNFLGRRGGNRSALHLNASGSISRRLPVLMTYVINLGVPPLLFAQVLYGRAFYTSSVLIGVWWIAVIFLLIGCYWHLYRCSEKIQNGQPGWMMALVALGLALVISRIYSTNMTLMLHPDVWQGMYAKSGIGAHLPPYDATLMPRWSFMLVGGLVAAGFWMIWLAGRRNIGEDVRAHLSSTGGLLASAGLGVEVWLAFRVFGAQPPDVVQKGLQASALYHTAGLVWLGGATLLLLVALWSALRKPVSSAPGWIGLVVGVVSMLAMVVYRDGIRDLTLRSRGFDVWQRAVVTNWTVVWLFIVLFVAGLGGLAWLISVVLRASPVSEKVAS